MKNLFRRAIKILDSQPAGARGQSLIELAFTTPILFLMIVSTAEIGFLANNYLVLLDAVREGARHGVTLSPITNWNDYETRSKFRTSCYGSDANFYNWIYNQTPANSGYYGPSDPSYTTNAPSVGAAAPVGFFDSIACQTIAALDPLQFVPFSSLKNTIDDVVVSVVSYLNVCTSSPANCYANGQQNFQIQTGTRQLVVTGRWPLSNRECTGERDPFDFPGRPSSVTLPGTADGKFRGFVMTGHSGTFNNGSCYGSKFDVTSLETLLNQVDSTSTNNTSVLGSVPSSAAVIVELSWQHHQLFGFPPLNFLGNPDIYVYQMFPVTAAEPTPTPAPLGP